MSNDVLAVSFSSRALLNIALENNGAAQQFNGREGETATFLSNLSVKL